MHQSLEVHICNQWVHAPILSLSLCVLSMRAVAHVISMKNYLGVNNQHLLMCPSRIQCCGVFYEAKGK